MKDKKIDTVEVCKEFEDVLAPRLKLTLVDRILYYYLLHHTRFQGELRQRFSLAGLGVKLGLSRRPVQNAMRRLANHGLLRLVERDYNGHLVEVRLPSEVLAALARRAGRRSKPPGDLDGIDFFRTARLRQTIHAREGGVCFYCLRRIPSGARCVDHVVPLARSGSNSYRNLVSCCMDCNIRKRDLPAEDFLRQLFREGRLSQGDLSARLQALRDLAAGKLRPQVFPDAHAGSDSKKPNEEQNPHPLQNQNRKG